MKLFVMLMVLSFNVFAWELPVRYVHDGDTIMVLVKELPKELQNMSVRIKGIDTPELRGKCAKEKQLAQEATELLENLVDKAPTITLKNVEWDKFGSRILADVVVNGNDLAKEMIRLGAARPYHGEAKKSWCD